MGFEVLCARARRFYGSLWSVMSLSHVTSQSPVILQVCTGGNSSLGWPEGVFQLRL